MTHTDLNKALEKVTPEYACILPDGHIVLDGEFSIGDLTRILEVLRKFTPEKT